VTAGSGAEAAGLKAGDLITSVDGKATGNVQELKEALSATKAGDTAEVVYVRPDKDGKYDESAAVSVKVTLQ
jgi:S1-C subfamily serine protease